MTVVTVLLYFVQQNQSLTFLAFLPSAAYHSPSPWHSLGSASNPLPVCVLPFLDPSSLSSLVQVSPQALGTKSLIKYIEHRWFTTVRCMVSPVLCWALASCEAEVLKYKHPILHVLFSSSQWTYGLKKYNIRVSPRFTFVQALQFS